MADENSTEGPVRIGINPDDPLIMNLQTISRDGDRLVKDLVILVQLIRQLLYLLGHPMRD